MACRAAEPYIDILIEKYSYVNILFEQKFELHHMLWFLGCSMRWPVGLSTQARDLRADEFLGICGFLEKDPFDFKAPPATPIAQDSE